LLKPLFDQVLIETTEKEGVTQGGIYIPDTAREKPAQGKVVAVGDGITAEGKTVVIPVKPGDLVIYKKWGGHEVKDGGKDYLLVEAKDIMALVEKGKNNG
jgi:chaperonin GroES